MYDRAAQKTVEEAMEDTRVVLVTGPRQAGKTTLVKRFAHAARPYLSFDDPATLHLAGADPTAFVRRLDNAVLDEVQRVPEVLLAIKRSVDADQRPGRFLLTGSADVMTLPTVADSLAGKIESVRLLPLSQAEILGHRSTFLTKIFSGSLPLPTHIELGDALVERVLCGGYPGALQRITPRRRRAWFQAYLNSVVSRDVRDVANIEQLSQMPRLLAAAGSYAGQLVNYSKIGSVLQMNYKTTQKYLGILQQLYLVAQLPPWSTRALNRAVKAPKLHFLDTGILAALQGLDAIKLQANRQSLGALLETFVFTELAKLVAAAPMGMQMAHLRNKDGSHEVAFVLEAPGGDIVGIEVKASSSVGPRDFSGLKQLAQACGQKFVMGVVLHDHDVIVPFGDTMFAAPLACLWH